MLARSLSGCYGAGCGGGAARVPPMIAAATSDACVGLTQVRFRRRMMRPPPWSLPKYEKIYESVKKEDRKWLEVALKDERLPVEESAWKRHSFATEKIPDNAGKAYSIETTKRIGLIGRKIGMTYQWLKDGSRVLCTLIHIPENHVVQTFDPEGWFKSNPIGKRKSFGIYGPRWNVLVGAQNAESIFFTDVYRRLFQRAGVPLKEHLAGFICTEDALVAPGTRLDARHFRVGQYVTVSGKTIDWGFQGVMHRWGMRGQPQRNTTKSHRRVGSIGSTGDARVWPGRRLPGHMGYEWRHAHSLEIVRINPVKQVLYVKGCVPGDIQETLLIKDELIPEKRVVDPPFPTFLTPIDEQEEEAEEFAALGAETHSMASRDEFAPHIFRFGDPSIEYTAEDETKLTARDKTKAKLAKVKK